MSSVATPFRRALFEPRNPEDDPGVTAEDLEALGGFEIAEEVLTPPGDFEPQWMGGWAADMRTLPDLPFTGRVCFLLEFLRVLTGLRVRTPCSHRNALPTVSVRIWLKDICWRLVLNPPLESSMQHFPLFIWFEHHAKSGKYSVIMMQNLPFEFGTQLSHWADMSDQCLYKSNENNEKQWKLCN